MKRANNQKNYLSQSFLFALLTMVILVGLWFLPSFEVGKQNTRKINVLSDIFSDKQLAQFFDSPTSDILVDKNEGSFVNQSTDNKVITSVKTPDQVLANAKKSITVQCDATDPELQENNKLNNKVDTISSDEVNNTRTTESNVQKVQYVEIKPVTVENVTSIPPVENMANHKFASFVDKLKSGKRVRIAVAGDSFIEGDIFTQDIREMLQQKYGGSGVGFVPITSQIAGFRQTIEHRFGGWETKSVTKNRGDYHLSGYLFIPTEGAWVKYKGSRYRKNLNNFKHAKLLFVNKNKTQIDVVVNDTIKMTFNPPASEQLQEISVNQDINSINFSVKNVNGFVAYGAVLDGDCGVSVDNYSVRSYSGAGLATISAKIASESDKIIPYDLVILQYGLNVANENNTNYTQYAKKLCEIIFNLQAIMPNTAIMVMSVSDRQSRSNGKTLASIYALEQTQRAVAKNCDVAFWSTLYAMQNAGGMGTFVKKGWAAKDYTHLSAKGGQVVANIFIKALDENNN